MRILIEGCDKTGKTTLAKKLANKYNLTIIKNSQPKINNILQEYLNIVNQDNIIIDRLHLSENVYGPLYRNTPIINFNKLENNIKNNTILILCTDSVDNIHNRFIEDGEEYTKITDIDYIVEQFNKLYEASTLIKMKYIINHQDLDYVLIQNILRNNK